MLQPSKSLLLIRKTFVFTAAGWQFILILLAEDPLHQWPAGCVSGNVKQLTWNQYAGACRVFSSFCNRSLSGCYNLSGWRCWPSKCRALRLSGEWSWMSPGSILWAMVVSCTQLQTEIKCCFCVLAFYQNRSLQLFPRLRETSLKFTAVSLRNMLSNCLVCVRLALVWFYFVSF